MNPNESPHTSLLTLAPAALALLLAALCPTAALAGSDVPELLVPDRLMEAPADPVEQSTVERAPFEPHALRNTGGWFMTGEVVGSIFLGFVLPDLVTNPPEVPNCDNSWCSTNGFDEALNPIFLSSNAHAMGTLSHVFTMGLVPITGLTGLIVPAVIEGKGSYAVQDSFIVINAFLLSTGPNSIAKVGARRQRPAFFYEREEGTEAADHPNEEFVSFYSGDTTWAFALASSASTLAFLRGYSHARYLAIGTGVLALTGGILRMTGDMHWATDVLAGAAVGTAIGVGLPLALHGRKKDSTVALMPSISNRSNGMALTGRW